MDHKLMAAARKSRKPQNAEPTLGFIEQLGQFLHRNLNWFLVIALALLLLQDIFGTHGVLAMRHSQQDATEIRKKIDQLDAENQKLQDRVKSLKTDPASIEKIAREEMGLARPGEMIFKISPRPGDASAPANQANEPQTKR
jgi:cell division protein FtsB